MICATGYRPRFPRIFLGGKQARLGCFDFSQITFHSVLEGPKF